MPKGCVWDELVGHGDVGERLRKALANDAASHAYLFVGPAGAGKKTAARALACALVCGDGGCGACPACNRVKRGFHPDVRVYAPEGAAGYLVEQTRDVIRDVHLAPVEAPRKVYVFETADAFNESAANALLKTLEEPPGGVTMVLLAHSYEAVLPTIASRCQVVRFARIPPARAAALLVERSGATRDDALAALAAAGGVMSRAADILRSPSRLETRRKVMSVMKDLPAMDGADVLAAARGLLASAKAPLDELKGEQADQLAESREFVGGSVKALEARHKRELTAREREGVGELLAVAESWLRDCLAMSEGAAELAVNRDSIDAMTEVAQALSAACALRALACVTETRKRISYNVSPQLALEAMLFEIREVLSCPR